MAMNDLAVREQLKEALATVPEVGLLVREIGSGGRIRTYDQAINSRPLYH